MDEHGFETAELDAGHETVARRLRTLQVGLRAVERARHRDVPTDGLVVDLNAAEAGAPPLALPVAGDGSPTPDVSAEPTAPVPIPEPAPAEPSRPPVAETRHSMWASFRAWWREEREARERELRARSFAQEAERLRELRALQPAAAVENTQALRNVMTFTEERFQALGIRSDTLHDELVGIARAIAELRVDGTVRIPDAADDLQERLDHLMLLLAEEMRRRTEELERSLSAQMTIQTAELATLLEEALMRMRTLIPEEMGRAADQISERVEAAVAAMPPVSVFDPPSARKRPSAPRAKSTSR